MHQWGPKSQPFLFCSLAKLQPSRISPTLSLPPCLSHSQIQPYIVFLPFLIYSTTFPIFLQHSSSKVIMVDAKPLLQSVLFLFLVCLGTYANGVQGFNKEKKKKVLNLQKFRLKQYGGTRTSACLSQKSSKSC